jgi:hypothetical protein
LAGTDNKVRSYARGVGRQFRNVTYYVDVVDVERSARVLREVLGLRSAFSRTGHIACFELAGFDVAACAHEAEPGHPRGTTELVFGHDGPDSATSDPDGRAVRFLNVEGHSACRGEVSDGLEFLNVTLYSSRIEEMVAFYRDGVGLSPDYEEPGHLCAMGHVAVHDPSEGPAGSARLYFLADDAKDFAARANEVGIPGIIRSDGYGKSAWQTDVATSLSVVVLTR